ncbi:RNase E specificity factor CsrD [Erwinia sp. OLTSP20]|uniref:RNase E specificity factor CsrD n=1 Tax=unclassified Erwinia TaxID=2622719 RepID=UPI000C18E209|nr:MULTISPECIES: RNase E specificity factor CsrD [unclassified Erwinia]PIJ51083.1 RNase E specificity factor CsrD [Erwinia sp. OAMSP11]PIJ73649.1 RNase E specificity factor CsrD [Erwinia sp. OLSSP12]PIJ83006.1 RNase E specificity factor CsrD [Erwinia sp. OLCASP19]PIJ85605.1 RNase E specificity factor CsrD [Erwinia sp. OLMTSP26]PIJ87746.1 RNase E specificity factor CsrD [Erwinia sp. OLMDSP33]
MRLTTKLSAFITFLSVLAVLLMLVGCLGSFFWLGTQRIEKRVNLIAMEVDAALQQQQIDQIGGWLRKMMLPMQIVRIDLVQQDKTLMQVMQHQDLLIKDAPNRYAETRIRLKNHPQLELRIYWLDTLKTWFRSLIGTSLMVAVGIVTLLMMIILLVANRWLYRQLKGMEQLEARAGRILTGERGSVEQGSVHEWPPRTSSALDLLLADLREAGDQRIRIDTLIRAFASQDARTGLHNRLFFDSQLANLLEDPENVGTHGVVMMIRLPDVESFREYWGAHRIDEYQFDVVNMLSTFVMRYPGALLARYFRSDYAVLLPHRTLKDADSIAAQLINAVDSLPPTRVIDRNDMIHIGITAWHSEQTTQQVMDSVEQATRHAALLGGNNWSVGEGTSQILGRGSVKWRTLLEQTLNRGGPRLYQKPALIRDNVVHHREMMPRIFDGEKEVLSAEYLPMIQQMGMAEKYDRLLVSGILSLLDIWPQEALAVPVTIDSLLQRSFLHWLRDALLQCSISQRKRILFELAEADVCQHISRLQPIFKFLYGFGCRVAINQAGLTVVSTAYIKQFSIELIKLHPGLVRNIDRRTENQLFVQSLVDVCAKTPTRVFAAGVRSAQEWHTLEKLGVFGGQGDFFAATQLVNRNSKNIRPE